MNQDNRDTIERAINAAEWRYLRIQSAINRAAARLHLGCTFRRLRTLHSEAHGARMALIALAKAVRA